MSDVRVLSSGELPLGAKKVVKAGETEILLIHQQDGLIAVQSKCPHAGAPLEQGAICNGRLVCPWHHGTFALPSGDLLEPPPLESLKTYSVRLSGQDIFVNPEPRSPLTTPARQVSEAPVFLLVGVGAAAVMAASTLHQAGFSARIIAVDPVAEEPVDRTQLSKDALSAKIPLDEIGFDTLAVVSAERVAASVTKLSAATQEAHLSNGRVVKFDKALVATGGHPKRLKIPGAELAYTLRHPADVRKILEASATTKSVVIIGTSFIALEAASALVQKKLQVTIAGKEMLPFAKQFGEPVALALKKLHEANGTRFRLGVEIVRLEPGAVIIRNGPSEERLPADLVIMGVGVSPQPNFTHDLPLAESGGGIRADQSLRAANSVWVAGDIANIDGTRIEHWRVAQQHGRVAALAMMGREAVYTGVPFFWTFHFGKRLGYLGHASEWDETVVKGDLEAMNFIVFYGQRRSLQAVLNSGFDSEAAELAERMRNPLTVDEALRVVRL